MLTKINRLLIITLVLTLVAGVLFLTNDKTKAENSVISVPTNPIPESSDFATLVLGDPWNMNDYSDISKYINESGERDVVRNINVQDGVFYGRSAGNVMGVQQQNGWFFTLFPGYETTVHAGKVGSRYPINSNEYQCLYIAMKVNSPAANGFGPDQFRVFWFGDDRLNTGNAPYGFTTGMALYPEYHAAAPNPVWKLYKVNLATAPMPPEVPGLVKWTDRATWQGLRIDPTINENVDYAVDWVRLTRCQPNNVQVNFTPNQTITAVWLRPVGTNRYIRVATDVNGASGSYNLDVQGIQPGSYYVGFGDQFNCCTTESDSYITINQTPIVSFSNPTFYSGNDFATVSGNPWDMSSPADISNIECVSDYGFADGKLWFFTLPSFLQPAQCRGSTPPYVADPRITLNMPGNQTIDPTQYRYLTFRMYDANPWQYVAQGSMVRWIWTVQGDSGLPGYRCHLVSHDIAFNVGWNTYTVDLWDSFAGSAEEWQGQCSSLPKNWLQSSPILSVRFDPNENITNHNFYQQIDWIRLTRPNTVSQGDLYRLELNKLFPEQNFNVTLFYTTNPSVQPMQRQIALSQQQNTPPDGGEHMVYLPIVVNQRNWSASDMEYLWDTTGVTPGDYYICAQVSDGLNEAVFCSEAAITVTE
jgi:hypothetical protein